MKDKILAQQYLDLLQKGERGFRDPDFKEPAAPTFDITESRVKLLAYYLPQFHPIPENDQWWGNGFTEWTNVTKALPQFPGHYQPHLPSDLGFYDLRVEEILERQVELAQKYGISGFCFYLYWFNGKRLLEKPLDTFHRRKDLNHNFCLCWANENWTRRWDGADAEILIEQVHTAESDQRFIADILEYMEDPRYIEIDSRPVLIVYRVPLLPEPKATAERWRELAQKTLGKDLFLIYAMTFGSENHPSEFGFDAAIQFPPHGISIGRLTDIIPYTPNYKSIFPYEELHAQSRPALSKYDFPVIPTVFPSWDNTARRGSLGTAFRGSTPDLYARWLKEAAYYSDKHPVSDKRFVVINAWNEWAEGAHLEPDAKFGHAYLRATSQVLRPYCPNHNSTSNFSTPIALTNRTAADSETALIIHAYYPEVLDYILSLLTDDMKKDVFISISGEKSAELFSIAIKHQCDQRISLHPNRGRDVRPFLFVLKDAADKGYKYIVKLHTKRSDHRANGNDWMPQLVQPLLSGLADGSLVKYFERHTDVGAIAPHGHILDGATFSGSSGNRIWLERLCHQFNITFPKKYSFIGGNMFAARLSDFETLADDRSILAWFEDEEAQLDGTLSHAIERFVGIILSHAGKNIAAAKEDNGRVTYVNAPIPEKKTYKFASAQP